MPPNMKHCKNDLLTLAGPFNQCADGACTRVLFFHFSVLNSAACSCGLGIWVLSQLLVGFNCFIAEVGARSLLNRVWPGILRKSRANFVFEICIEAIFWVGGAHRVSSLPARLEL